MLSRNRTIRNALLLSLALGFLIAGTPTSAQYLDNKGTDFIIGFLPNISSGSDCELHLTAETATDVTIQYPYSAPIFTTTVAVTPGNITVVSLPSNVADSWTFGVAYNNCVHAFAGDEFICYMVNRQSATSDAALALPTDVMNTEFIVATYRGSALHSSDGGEFAVVAAYPGTDVTITPTRDLVGGYLAGVPFTVTLNPGEGFLGRTTANSGSGADIAGTIVTATRPIGLTNGNKCTNIPPSITACDHVFEVAQAVQTWGTRVFCVNLPNRPGGSIYRILGSEDNTAVTLDGAPLVTLNRGDVYETGIIPGSHIVEGDKPIFVVQFMTGQDNPGATSGDPAMGNLAPAEQYLSSYTFSTIGGAQFAENYLTIVAHNDDVGFLTLDGTPVNASNFDPIGSSDYSSAILALTEGAHTTYSPNEPHGITVEGFNSYDSYIYPGGAMFAPIADTTGDTIPPICEVAYDDCIAFGTATEVGDSISGILAVILDPGSVNLLLEVDPDQPGSGNVTVYDLEGNTCESAIDIDCGQTWDCYPDLPPPVLIVEECAEQTLSSTKFFLDVLNWSDYPDELFEPAPDLPPCGDNPNSSRSWVDIFDQDDNRLYGFCALGQSSNLNLMWFSIQGGIWPDSVYITITDRRCDIVYTSNKAPIENIKFPPTVLCPEDEFIITLQNPDDVCIPLPIAGAVTVTAGDATWENGQLCFYADQSDIYVFHVVASNDCGDDYCDVYVDVTIGGVNPTPEWINVFCYEPMLNGIPLNEGDIVRAYDPDGVLCGMDVITAEGTFGFMPVYRDDPFSPGIDEGADPGDVITFSINGEIVFTDPTVIWTANGDLVELCSFNTCKTIHLNAGWNLISWNLNYAASIEDFLMDQFDGTDCLDVILSFDMGALTYDPLLPDFATLHSVDYYHGYWIRLDCDWDIEICGQMIDPGEYINVYTGWNLVSYWPTETMTVEDGFVSILDVLQVAIGFDNGGHVWLPGDPSMNTLTELGECFGYWIKVGEDRTLCYPGWCNGAPSPAKIDPNVASVDVTPSRYWMSIYGKNLTLDGNDIENGAKIEIYSAEGLLCGVGSYENGLLRFTPIYGHDELDNATAGYPRNDELVSLHVNGVRVYPDMVWSGHGNSERLDNLSTTKSGSMTPSSFRLAQNYPNPFNPTTVISFSLESPGRVDLAIYNLLGQSIRTLISADMRAGDHETVWDGTDDNGMPVSSGVYFYRLQAGSFSKTMKMMLMK
jgi:hypothetical protein